MQFIISLPKNLVLLLLKFYQKILSPDHSFWGKDSGLRYCRHYPSCSHYAYEVVEKYGVIKGLWLGFFRVLRCNPWSKGGYDPVP